MYINGLRRASSQLKSILFADDATFFAEGRDLSEMCREVSIEFNKISTRFKVHKLSLNISKTYYIIFNLVNATYEENINMGNVDIDKVHC